MTRTRLKGRLHSWLDKEVLRLEWGNVVDQRCFVDRIPTQRTKCASSWSQRHPSNDSLRRLRRVVTNVTKSRVAPIAKYGRARWREKTIGSQTMERKTSHDCYMPFVWGYPNLLCLIGPDGLLEESKRRGEWD
mmetsp:Transcript_13841/g.28376  ORF Transcript_13841/g.28376 Transcript_13841/m.28376 type:complete len:133 (+) Transcript_13841:566-964(+)